MNAPLVFLDTETTGLSLDDDIWELAAIRREPDGAETELHLFVQHDNEKCAKLPGSFQVDHARRYKAAEAITPALAALALHDLFTHPFSDVKPHVVGAVPNFDTERLARLLARYEFATPWHYHLIDVENLAVGYLAGVHAFAAERPMLDALKNVDMASAPHTSLPWKSDDLAAALGVTITEDDRHTAMGDARWAQRIYDRVMGGVS